MNEKITVRPDKIRLVNLLAEIAKGTIKIPIFQRTFIWRSNQMIDLFDSIAKGYPMGSLLFWRPEKDYKTKQEIGPYTIEPTKKDVLYVLDGFQRITTLFSVLTNPAEYGLVENSDKLKKYTIYYDLKNREFTLTKVKKDKDMYTMPLYKIVDTYEFLDSVQKIKEDFPENSTLSKRLIDNAKEIVKVFYDYEIPFVEINGGDIESAVRIFSRVNSTGTEISEDFMLAALSYNEETNFLFTDLITEFLNGLSKYNFEETKRDTILNCISNSSNKIYFDVKKEELLPDLANLTKSSLPHIETTIKFLYEELFVLNYQLLPYPTQLIFMDNFFKLVSCPDREKLEKLKKWFWVTTYSNYYSIYSISQQRSAYKVFMEFIEDTNSKTEGIYRPEEIKFFTLKFPDKLNFTGVRSKALRLFLLQTICSTRTPLQTNETVKEQFFFNKKDKTPANIILRLSSEFAEDPKKQELKDFIEKSDISTLKKYFITEEMKLLFIENRVEDFLTQREQLIKKAEKKFVESLGISYDEGNEDGN